MKWRNPWLIVAGGSSAFAALAHIACIVGGAQWYRTLGAPPGYVRAAERGSWMPGLMTAGIAALLTLCAAYAFAGAGLTARLPLLRLGLLTITAVYLLRGMIVVYPRLLGRPDLSASFVLWSSIIVLAMGLVHAIGVWRGWKDL